MSKKGFTVIEMLIVLSIIGSIALISLPQLIRARYKADLTSCLTYESKLAQALEIRKNQRESYPDSLEQLVNENIIKNRIPVCPSNGESYNLGYEIADDYSRYTINCPGIHYRMINIPEGYPKYSSESGLITGQ